MLLTSSLLAVDGTVEAAPREYFAMDFSRLHPDYSTTPSTVGSFIVYEDILDTAGVAANDGAQLDLRVTLSSYSANATGTVAFNTVNTDDIAIVQSGGYGDRRRWEFEFLYADDIDDGIVDRGLAPPMDFQLLFYDLDDPAKALRVLGADGYTLEASAFSSVSICLEALSAATSHSYDPDLGEVCVSGDGDALDDGLPTTNAQRNRAASVDFLERNSATIDTWLVRDTPLSQNFLIDGGFRPSWTNPTAESNVDGNIELTKTAKVNGLGNVGDTITYSFVVTNNGANVLTDVAINDPRAPVNIDDSRDGDNDGDIDYVLVGESVMATAEYTVTAADVAAGIVDNTASVIGVSPNGEPVSDADTASTSIPISPEANPDQSLLNERWDTVTVEVVANDVGADPETVQIIDPVTGEGLNRLITSQGTWESPAENTAGRITFTPAAGITRDPEPIDYEVAAVDGSATMRSTLTVTYRVTPEAHPDESLDNPPLNPIEIDVLANDVGVDPATVQFVDPETDLPESSLVAPGETGQWTVDEAGLVTYTPWTSQTDPEPVTYQVDALDGSGPVSATLTVTFAKPIAHADESLGASATEPVEFDVTANDISVDSSTVQLLDPVSGASTTSIRVAQGLWSADESGVVTFAPVAGVTDSPDTVTYQVDALDGSGPVSATLTVGFAPVAHPDESLNNTPGVTVQLDVTGNDVEVSPATVRLVYPGTSDAVMTVQMPDQGTWSVDPATGLITFEPQSDSIGDLDPMTYQVMSTDGLGPLTSTATISYQPSAATTTTTTTAATTTTTAATTTTTTTATTTNGVGASFSQNTNSVTHAKYARASTQTGAKTTGDTDQELPTSGAPSDTVTTAALMTLVAGGLLVCVGRRRRLRFGSGRP